MGELRPSVGVYRVVASGGVCHHCQEEAVFYVRPFSPAFVAPELLTCMRPTHVAMAVLRMLNGEDGSDA